MLNRQKPLNSQSKLSVAGLNKRDVEEFLYHHLRNANLQKQGIINNTAKDLRFSSEHLFWEKVLRTRYEERIGLRWVELTGFQIVDWFPRAPGLFHTRDAEYTRQQAEKYVSEENGVQFYKPEGKMHMINGGIGSVRFKPIMIGGDDYWLCTATSNNTCHSGVPIAINNAIIDDVDFAFHKLTKITGQVKFLPNFLENYWQHTENIPQIYVEVDNITQLGHEKMRSVNITPMIFFSTQYQEEFVTEENVTFITCQANSGSEMDNAVDWLEWYVDKYHGQIVTNFDQQQPRFADAPFSLQNVMGGNLNPDRLPYRIQNANIVCETVQRIQAEAVTMTKINVKLGDGTTIHGDFIVANTIKNSFNKVETADISKDLKSLLKDLTKAVAKMSEKLPIETAEHVVRDLDTLASEATSKSPRKQWWQLSIDGLTKAAKDIGEIGKPVLELAAKIVAILTVMQK